MSVSAILRPIVAVVAVLAIGIGLWELQSASSGLGIVRVWVGSVPVTVFRREGGGPAPVVVIAHGFAGSQQLMLPFAATLARNGYVAVTFDFPGHGRNAVPMPGGIVDNTANNQVLIDALGVAVDFARGLPGTDGRLGLLGHSMATDVLMRYAADHAGIDAVVAVSMFSTVVTPGMPRNLLVVMVWVLLAVVFVYWYLFVR